MKKIVIFCVLSFLGVVCAWRRFGTAQTVFLRGKERYT
jgi:E3 ubiquitin-protein ligase DOA10